MASLESLLPECLTTPRLTLQLFDYSEEHYTCLLTAMNTPAAHEMMGDYGIKTPQAFDKMLLSSRLNPAALPETVIVDIDAYYMIHLCKSEGPLIGAISFAQRHPLAPPDIGWCLLDTYHRQGYASEAAIEVLRMLKEDLGVKEIICWPRKSNVASQRTARRAGFVHEGKAKNTKGEDVVVYVLPGMHFDSDLRLSLYGGS